ncbi:MAG: hypothetical protein BGO98_31035 [Myxococcales bacterium 68-20]|nr:MAG: hypothetical protein BGO98_31035 [Myxococcales bacterium 68-20]
MRSPIRSLPLVMLLVVPAAWIACSSDRAIYDEGAQVFEAPPEAGLDSCEGLACSRDLRSVLDCTGNVVERCAEDQACGNQRCIDPCSAAAANAGSVGCSFAVPPPNGDLIGRGNCYAFFVANNWTSPATLRLEFDGQEKALDGAVWVSSVENGKVKHTQLDGPIPPGGGAVVFFSEDQRHAGSQTFTACPDGVRPVLDRDPVVHETGIGRTSFVTANVPVSMYAIYPYGGAKTHFPSATLLFPTTSFGDKYVLLSAWGGKGDTFGRGMLRGADTATTQFGKPTIQIVAIEDETTLELLPRVDIVGGPGVAASSRGQVASYRLKRGDVLQLTQENELVGSVMESNKPVGVFAGSSGLNVPSDVRAADQENDQIPPVSAWGHEYAVVPAPNRASLLSQGREKERDPSVIRIVGAADGTELVYEPAAPKEAPRRLGAGELATFFAEQPFVVRSQDSDHPFFVAAYMTGAAASSYEVGDPELAMVVATDQWLDTYGFFSDSNYDSSSVVVTRRKDRGSFHDVALDCAGTLTGWTAITPEYEWAQVTLTRSGDAQRYDAGTCTDGAHRIQSEGPFTITVWGVSGYASYAYPGGTGLRPISRTNLTVR